MPRSQRGSVPLPTRCAPLDRDYYLAGCEVALVGTTGLAGRAQRDTSGAVAAAGPVRVNVISSRRSFLLVSMF